VGIFDFFRKKNKMGGENPPGFEVIESDLDEGEGGPSIYIRELNNLRWIAGQNGLDVARRPSKVDPLRWSQLPMRFAYEEGLSDHHEGYRHQLANHVGARIRDDIRDLYDLAADATVAREGLEDADRALLVTLRDWKEKRDEIAHDEIEVDRYYRAKSLFSTFAKYALAALIVISEFIISTEAFKIVFTNLPSDLFAYILAFGVTMLLIAVPHFTALGLKRGLTQYHLSKQKELEERHEEIPAEIRRAVHIEEMDDKGFRLAVIGLAVGIVLLVLPLSWIRAADADTEKVSGWAIFLFLLMLQSVMSGYFFLREWLDWGHISSGLKEMEHTKDLKEKAREEAFDGWNRAVAAFRDSAEDLIFDLEQIPHWDGLITTAYEGSLWGGRTVLQIEQGEYEEFLVKTHIPPLADLDDHDMYSDRWLIDRAVEGVADARGEEVPEGDDSQPDEGEETDRTVRTWLDAKDPWLLLRRWLPEIGDRPFTYTRPEELDYLGADTPDGEPKDEGSEEPESGEPTGETTEGADDGAGGQPLSIVPKADDPASASGGSTPS